MYSLIRIQLSFLALTTFSAFAAVEVASAAGPSSKNPQMLLSPWTDESVSKRPVEYYAAAVAIYEQVSTDVERYEAAAKGGKVKSLNLIKVGMTRALISDLEQYGIRLVGWGEPSGQDLVYRALDLDQRLAKIGNELRPLYLDQINKGLVALQNRSKQQQKLLKVVRKLMDDGKLDAAEKKYQGEYRKLAAMAFWYEYQQRLAPMKVYDEVYSTLNTAIQNENKKEARKVIAELCDRTRPDLKKLPAEVAKAAASLGMAAEVEFDGKTLSGPKVFMTAAKEWYGLHRATLRTIGMHWAMADRDSGLPPIDEVVASYATFHGEMLKSLASVIQADAGRAGEADAAQLYTAYVKGIADITSVSRDEELIKTFEGPLETLAGKAPLLAGDRTSYQGATGDWLRWRRRSAESAAGGKRPKATEVSLPLRGAGDPKLTIPATQLVVRLGEEAVGKEVAVAAEFLSVAKSGKPTSGYLEWMFCRALLDSVPTDPSLETDLLASEDKPALTLAAARALANLKRGTLLEVGGKLADVELIGMIPFYAVDSDDRKAVVTIGALPKIATEGYDYPAKYLHFIAEVEPTWVRGEYFFAEVK